MSGRISSTSRSRRACCSPYYRASEAKRSRGRPFRFPEGSPPQVDDEQGDGKNQPAPGHLDRHNPGGPDSHPPPFPYNRARSVPRNCERRLGRGAIDDWR
jgi:hypothetical protein